MFGKNPFSTPLFDTPRTSTNRRTLFDSQVNRGGLKQVSSNNAVETPPARGRVSLMCHFSSSSSSSLTYAHTFYEKRKCWRWPGYTHMMMMHTTTTVEGAILPHVPSPTSCSDTACLTEDKNILYKNREGKARCSTFGECFGNKKIGHSVGCQGRRELIFYAGKMRQCRYG